MRSNLALISGRLKGNLWESGTEVVDGVRRGQILLTWKVWPAGSTVDPVTQAKSGTPVTLTERVPGFVHMVNIARGTVVQFNEFEDGDCIIDLAPDVAIDGREELRFTIAGEVWELKLLAGKVPKSWDVVASGVKLMRSLLLRKAT